MQTEKETEKEKINRITNELIANIDPMLDDVGSHYNFRFMYYFEDYLHNHYGSKIKNIKRRICAKVQEYYHAKCLELEEVLSLTKQNADTEEKLQLYEAYSSFKKNDIRNMYNFVNQIIIDCESILTFFTERIVWNRRRNKNRQKPERIVNKIDVLSENEEFDLKSMDLTDIHKCTTILAFYPDKREFIIFESIDGLPFQTGKARLLNARARRKISRTNIKEKLDEMMNASRDKLITLFEAINQKERRTQAKVYPNMILLKGYTK